VSSDAGLEVYSKRFQFLVETARKAGKCAVPRDYKFALAVGNDGWATRYVTPPAGAGISIDAALVSTPVDQAAYEQVFEAMEERPR